VTFIVDKLNMPMTLEEVLKNEKPQITVEHKRQLVDSLYADRIMANEGRRRGFNELEEFKKPFKYLIDSEIFNLYKFMFVMGAKVPTNAELLERYNKEHRNRGVSFASIRNDLKAEMFNNTRLNNRLEWEAKVLAEANFEINEKKLVPDKPLKPGETPPAPTY